jgi:hypothetical protein
MDQSAGFKQRYAKKNRCFVRRGRIPVSRILVPAANMCGCPMRLSNIPQIARRPRLPNMLSGMASTWSGRMPMPVRVDDSEESAGTAPITQRCCKRECRLQSDSGRNYQLHKAEALDGAFAPGKRYKGSASRGPH